MMTHDYIPRHIEERIHSAMTHMKIVSTGAHGSGKTTLAQKIAKERGMKFVSLDDPNTCDQALRDPNDFIKKLVFTGGVIDELHKDPQLARAIGWHLENDQRPGRLMVTGSANIVASLSRKLRGTIMLPLELGTLSQEEIEGLPVGSDFLTAAQTREYHPLDPYTLLSSGSIWPRILRGGYPGAVMSENSKQARQWLKEHANLLTNTYIPKHFEIQGTEKFEEFVLYLAELSGTYLDLPALAKKINVKLKTARHWLWILSNSYIACPMINWIYPDFRGPVPKPVKIHFFDSGLLATLRGSEDIDSIPHGQKRQTLLETFVHGELCKSIKNTTTDPLLYGYRHRSGVEVDFMIESDTHFIAMDVKAFSSLSSSDFDGLKHLRKVTGGIPLGQMHGVVFYTGEEVQCFDENIYAMPIRRLWEYSTSKAKPIITKKAVATA